MNLRRKVDAVSYGEGVCGGRKGHTNSYFGQLLVADKENRMQDGQAHKCEMDERAFE